MMPARRRRLTPEARRQEILEAAERLLRRDGSSVRVEDIVTEAGAAKGTFFVCFPSWDDLLETIRSRLAGPFRERIPEIPDPAVPRDWTGVLPHFATALVDFILGMEGLHEVLFHGPFPLARPLPPEQKPGVLIAALLRAGAAAGAYPPLDARLSADLIFAMIHETADAIAAGADRERTLAALHVLLRRIVAEPGQ